MVVVVVHRRIEVGLTRFIRLTGEGGGLTADRWLMTKRWPWSIGNNTGWESGSATRWIIEIIGIPILLRFNTCFRSENIYGAGNGWETNKCIRIFFFFTVCFVDCGKYRSFFATIFVNVINFELDIGISISFLSLSFFHGTLDWFSKVIFSFFFSKRLPTIKKLSYYVVADETAKFSIKLSTSKVLLKNNINQSTIHQTWCNLNSWWNL